MKKAASTSGIHKQDSELTKYLKNLLYPYAGVSSEEPQPEKEEAMARNALIEVLAILRLKPGTKPYYGPDHWVPNIDYMSMLQHIYFELDNQRFASACNEVFTYLSYYPIEQRRIRDGLVLLLEKLEHGDF